MEKTCISPEVQKEIETKRLKHLIDYFMTHDRVYIDACTLMEAPKSFYERIFMILPQVMKKKFGDEKEAKLFSTTMAVVSEILKISEHDCASDSRYTPKQVEKAGHAFGLLKKLKERDLLYVWEDVTQDQHGDKSLMAVAAAAGSLKIGFLTQDRQLASDLHRMREMESSKFRHTVSRVDTYGFIGRNDGTSATTAGIRSTSAVSAPAVPAPATVKLIRDRNKGSIPMFCHTGEATSEVDFILPFGEDLYTGDKLDRVAGEQLVLGEEISSGSEATVFEVEGVPGMAAKIFREPTRYKEKKVCLLASRSFDVEGVTFPEEPLYYKGFFVGHLMPLLPKTVSLDAIFTDTGKNLYCRDWDRSRFASLALKLSRLFHCLHTRGIILADISGGNVRVALDSKGQADPDQGLYIIDVDSAQIGMAGKVFPPSGVTPEYVAPDWQKEVRERGGWPKEKLLPFRAEQFACTLLIARIIMCGLHPFRAINGESDDKEVQDHIERRELPFSAGEVKRTGVAPGLGTYLWSNLPGGIKTALHQTLTAADPDERMPLPEIIRQLEHYCSWIHDPENRKHFPEITSILPTRLKPYFRKCDKCGSTFDAMAEGMTGGNGALCGRCAEEPVSWCSECGKPTLTRGAKLRGHYAHKLCTDCWENSKKQFSRFVFCETCGRSFAITREQEAAGAPSTCPECTAAAAQTAAAAAPAEPRYRQTNRLTSRRLTELLKKAAGYL